jgi:hypothetical protein
LQAMTCTTCLVNAEVVLVLPGSWTPPTLSGRPLPNPAYSGLELSRAFSMDQTIAPAIASTEPASAVASMACLPAAKYA